MRLQWNILVEEGTSSGQGCPVHIAGEGTQVEQALGCGSIGLGYHQQGKSGVACKGTWQGCLAEEIIAIKGQASGSDPDWLVGGCSLSQGVGVARAVSPGTGLAPGEEVAEESAKPSPFISLPFNQRVSPAKESV